MGDLTYTATAVTSFCQITQGLLAVSLTDYTTSALSTIGIGSAVEIAGSVFYAKTAATPQATTWTAITTGNSAYLGLVPTGSGSTQTAIAQWLSVTSVWRDDFYGWYASAASNTRVICSAYKVSNTQQESKQLYTKGKDRIFNKILDIGDWDMDAVPSINVAHRLTKNKIRSVAAMIRDDTDNQSFMLTPYSAISNGQIFAIDATNVNLSRLNSGDYDSVNYDSTSYNRGWVTISYEA